MPNFNLNVTGISANGLKCDGPKYTQLFRACYEKVAKNSANLKTSSDATAAFWKEWDVISAPYHTGDAGKRKYSAPFIAAIGQAFVVSAPAKTEKTA